MYTANLPHSSIKSIKYAPHLKNFHLLLLLHVKVTLEDYHMFQTLTNVLLPNTAWNSSSNTPGRCTGGKFFLLTVKVKSSYFIHQQRTLIVNCHFVCDCLVLQLYFKWKKRTGGYLALFPNPKWIWFQHKSSCTR